MRDIPERRHDHEYFFITTFYKEFLTLVKDTTYFTQNPKAIGVCVFSLINYSLVSSFFNVRFISLFFLLTLEEFPT